MPPTDDTKPQKDRSTASNDGTPPMKVAVIGGAGHIGSWFTEHFTSKGLPTVIADTRMDEARAIADATGAELAHSNLEAVEGVDAVLVCVPIKKTGEVISEITPRMKKGALLADLTSVKATTLEHLRAAAQTGVKPLSIHPLFGPAADGLKGKTILVVPVMDGEEEATSAKQLFGEAEIIVVGPEEHDRAMASVLSLTYFMNMAFAGILGEEDLLRTKKLSGTTFTVQLVVTESIIGEDPGLVSSLLSENPYTQEYLDRYISEAEHIRTLLKDDPQGLQKLHGSLAKSMSRDPDFRHADERRYRAFKALNSHG